MNKDVVQLRAGSVDYTQLENQNLGLSCVECVRENHNFCFIKSTKVPGSALPSSLTTLLSIPVTSGTGSCCHTSSNSPACNPIAFQEYANMAEFADYEYQLICRGAGSGVYHESPLEESVPADSSWAYELCPHDPN